MNIQLANVRLSYPAIWKPKAFAAASPGEQTSEPKYQATALISKTTDPKSEDFPRVIVDGKPQPDAVKALQAAIQAVAEEKWGKGKVPKAMNPCLHDGSEKDDTDGYGDGVVFIGASSKNRVPVIDRDLTPLTEESGRPYAGCYVNISIKLWAQDNQYGKRVNAQLRAIQFVRKGEPFGEAPVDVNKEFQALPDSGATDPSLE